MRRIISLAIFLLPHIYIYYCCRCGKARRNSHFYAL
nr:MAG TPA: protein of unknown function DUF1660 [Caudoviricetes sp.]